MYMMTIPLFISPNPLLFRRAHCRTNSSKKPTARACDKNIQNRNIDFIKDRLDDLRTLMSASSSAYVPPLSSFPSLDTLPSLSSLQRLALLSTFRALAPTPLDHLCPIPSQPPFNRILALNLATYAFRAYQDPPSSAYRETFTTNVGDTHIIQTDFVYPSTEQIAFNATGLFLLKTPILDGYITARINQATVRDPNRIGHLSVLNILHADHENDHVLHLYLSPSTDFKNTSPSHVATLPLKVMVETAVKTQKQISLPPQQIVFEPIDYERECTDFFGVSLLPAELRLPFWINGHQQENYINLSNKLKTTVEPSFVPFARQNKTATSSHSDTISPDQEQQFVDIDDEISNAIEALGEAIQGAAEEQDEAERSMVRRDRKKRDALSDMLRKQLPEGTMPAPKDWKRLVEAANLVTANLAAEPVGENVLDMNATPCLFVESHATDTEVWFFRDMKHMSLVISFRGTEQVSWKDFFTDAQAFLQRWMPGEEIDLTVSSKNTVGLADFVPSIVGKNEIGETVADDVGAVHYGFLRAYMSVRESIARGIQLLTAGANDYRLIFTGHSLGGALATLAAGDFAARRGGEICCMSYGAPKVGNFNFASRFNELVPNAFRVVNDSDLVSRMPRSPSGGRAVDRYKHSGRTVLVNDFGDYWIEGENDALLQESERGIRNPFRERFKDLKEMIEHEKELWEQLLSGISVKHHMEDSYFMAIQEVLKRVAEDLD